MGGKTGRGAGCPRWGRGGGRPEAAITAGDCVRGDDSGATTTERQRKGVPSGVTRCPCSTSPWGVPVASRRATAASRSSTATANVGGFSPAEAIHCASQLAPGALGSLTASSST